MYACSLERMKDKIATFSKFGDAGHGGITRYSLSEAAIQARNEFRRRMEAIGAVIEIDDVANMYATLPGSDPDAKRIVMASHVDSVKNGGNYDGILGVMSAMEVLETVHEKQIPHKHPLTAMIWTNEEGSLYPPAMMCSGIVCYDYLPEDIRAKFAYDDMMQSKSILDGKSTFGEALAKSGFQGDRKYRLNPEQYQYMFETHIEQGPILEWMPEMTSAWWTVCWECSTTAFSSTDRPPTPRHIPHAETKGCPLCSIRSTVLSAPGDRQAGLQRPGVHHW